MTIADKERMAPTDAGVRASAPARSLFVRSVYAGRDLELFLVTAVATILIVRAALAATGWPQFGGGPIHFAHLLWGGLGMLIALMLFMAMQGRLWKELATLAAGIGFGLFIDELGKFITSDNNYFFKPTIAIIYAIFIVLLLVTRALAHQRLITPQAALVNTFDIAKEAVIRDLDEGERREALALLERCDPDDPIVQRLGQMLREMSPSVERRDLPFARVRRRLAEAYSSLVARPWFKTLVVGWYVVVSLVALAYPFVTEGGGTLTFAERGQVVSAAVAGALVAIGILRWRQSRLAAYRWFQRAMLVTVFLYEFFAFYEDQLRALPGLVIVLLTYVTIRLMVREEEAREHVRARHQTLLA